MCVFIVSLISELGDFCSIITVLKKKFLEVIYFNFAICLSAIMIIQLFYARYPFLYCCHSFLWVTNDTTLHMIAPRDGSSTYCRLTLVFSCRSRTNTAHSVKIYLHPVKKVGHS